MSVNFFLFVPPEVLYWAFGTQRIDSGRFFSFIDKLKSLYSHLPSLSSDFSDTILSSLLPYQFYDKPDTHWIKSAIKVAAMLYEEGVLFINTPYTNSLRDYITSQIDKILSVESELRVLYERELYLWQLLLKRLDFET